MRVTSTPLSGLTASRYCSPSSAATDQVTGSTPSPLLHPQGADAAADMNRASRDLRVPENPQ
jgi:hypothetical protein